MRIVVTGEGIGPRTGGGRTGILGICRGLARRGHDVILLATNQDGPDTLDVALGVPVVEAGVSIYFYPATRALGGYVFSRQMARALKREIGRADVVLIHSLYRFTSTVAAYYCRKLGVPYVLRPHGTLDPFILYRGNWPLKRLYIHLFEKRNFNHAAAVQYSSQMEQDMTAQFVALAAPGLVISEGIELRDFRDLPARGTFRSRFRVPEGKQLLLFLGRFHPKKGIELLLEAFAMASRVRTQAHLVLAGSGDTAYVNHISADVERHGLSSSVTLTGHLDAADKLAALADADLFVLPSHGENFGLAVVEAMACGVPVLISNKVGICQEIASAGAGLVVACDVQQIADAMARFVHEPALHAQAAERGRVLAETRFSLDSMAQRMELEYQRLSKRAEPAPVPHAAS